MSTADQRALADPVFRRFLTARAVCMAGNVLTMVALPVLVYRLTSSPALTAMIAVAETAPYLVVGLPAGALVDRWNRRRVLVWTETLSGLALLTVPLADAAGVLTVGHLLGAAVAVSTLFVVGDAATFGVVPHMVGRRRVASATSTLVSVGTSIGLVGPLVAGLLVTTTSPVVAIGVDGVGYLVSAAVIARLRWSGSESIAPAGPDRRLGREIAEGLRFIWRTRVVRWLTVLGIGTSLAGGATSGLLVVIGVEQLGLAPTSSALGWLFAAGALGTFAASLALPRVQGRVGVGVITTAGYATALVAMLWLAQTRSLAAALPVLAVLNYAMTTVIVNGIVTRQVVTPQHLQSRVNTTARLVAWGGSPLGAALGGLLAGPLGTPGALRVASVGLAASLAGALAVRLHRVGRLDVLAGEASTAPASAT